MGFAISWLAIKGKSKEQILAEFELRDTGEADDAYEAPISGAPLPNGWYLLFLKRYDHPLVQPRTLRKSSDGCQIIACKVEEHVMAGSAVAYENGRELWDVSHEGDVEVLNLKATGNLPANYTSIRDRRIKQQESEGGEKADVDYIIEIPFDLAVEICGFKHDEREFAWGAPRFTKLESTAARKSIWPWRR